MRSAVALLPFCLSLLLAPPLRGQAPERTDRFDAAPSAPRPAIRNASSSDLRREADPPRSAIGRANHDSRTAFGVILGVVGGALIGVRMAPCDYMGPPPQMFVGALAGGGLMFLVARLTPR